MANFRKRPVEIEAFKVSDMIQACNFNWHLMPVWLSQACGEGNVLFASDHVLIKTLEGEHRGDLDDWIIRGVKGELYPCKPDIFAMTYEPV